MRKQIEQAVDIIREVRNKYNSQDKSDKPIDKLVNDAMHIVEEKWNIPSFGIADVPSRKLRPYIQNTSHFKGLVKDWLIEGSDELKHCLWLSRLCADKTTLYQTITGFQPSIGRHFVAFHTISTTDPEEPCLLKKAQSDVAECNLIEDFFGEDVRRSSSPNINQDENFEELIFCEFGLSPNSRQYQEGKARFRLHIVKERNRKLIEDAKKFWKKQNEEPIRCSVCSFSFKERYGEIGTDFIEAHHKEPISSLTEETSISIEDLVPVCSNCHRMLHRGKFLLSIEDLRKQLN